MNFNTYFLNWKFFPTENLNYGVWTAIDPCEPTRKFAIKPPEPTDPQNWYTVGYFKDSLWFVLSRGKDVELLAWKALKCRLEEMISIVYIRPHLHSTKEVETLSQFLKGKND